MGMSRTAIDRLAEMTRTKVTEDTSLVGQAMEFFHDWKKAYDITDTNVTPETLIITREAFVDGYLRGVQKKITGE